MVIGRPAHVGCCALVAHAAGALRGQGQPPRQRLPAGVLATPARAPPACPAPPGPPRRVHGRLQPCSSKALGRLQQGRAMRCSALRACMCCTGSSRRPAWAQRGPSCTVSMLPHALLWTAASTARRACAATRAAAPAPAERSAARPSARRLGGRARWASTCAAASARSGRTAPSAAPSATWARSRSSSWARLRWACSQARLICLVSGSRAGLQPGSLAAAGAFLCGKVHQRRHACAVCAGWHRSGAGSRAAHAAVASLGSPARCVGTSALHRQVVVPSLAVSAAAASGSRRDPGWRSW